MIETGGFGVLSYAAQNAFREAYALCLVGQLLITVTGARRFFCSQRYGGYVAASTLRDKIYQPTIVNLACGLWLMSALSLLVGYKTVFAALANVVLCRFLLIGPRWNSLSRGFGAVGQITAWAAVATFLLELTRVVDHAGLIRTATVTVARVDFGLIMLVAGFYKLTAGYTRGDGFESALVNPWWSYWSKHLQRLSTRNLLFAILNHSSYTVEMVAGVLMLTPFYEYGALAVALSFAFLALTLRLTFLPAMIVSTFFLFVAPGGMVDSFLPRASSPPPIPDSASLIWIPLFTAVCAYGVAIVAVRAGLYYNFFGRRRLPEALQVAVDLMSNHLLITIWRVFTANVINFYVEISIERSDGIRSPYERIGFRSWREDLRFAHAGEFVALCTTFTTLKYFPHSPHVFEERLIRYASTVPALQGERVVFTYMSIAKDAKFAYVPVAEFAVEPSQSKVEERCLHPGFDVRSASPNSPIVPAAAHGSYAPARK